MCVVYVICPDANAPSGGIMKLYELVDTLNTEGISSYIVHEQRYFLMNWFTHHTRSIDIKSVQPEENDILVYPEIFADRVVYLFPGIRKIIFNQNSFNTFKPFPNADSAASHSYLHKDIIQVITVSSYDYRCLKWLFPEIPLSRVTYGIRRELFHFNDFKQKIIAVMPRKGKEDFKLLLKILEQRVNLKGFGIKLIDKTTLDQSAAILRNAAIFLSFSDKESFGLPPAEAMACGCIVIGYHGQGGKEFFRDGLAFEIQNSDIVGYAIQIQSVIDIFENDPGQLFEMAKNAAQYISKSYSMEMQKDSILRIFKQFI